MAQHTQPEPTSDPVTATATASYTSEESPTLSISRPALNWLARTTLPDIEIPEETPQPHTVQSVADAEPTQPSFRRDLAELPRAESKRGQARSTPLIVAGFVLTAGVLAGACWIYVLGPQPLQVPTRTVTQATAALTASKPTRSNEPHSAAATPTLTAPAPRAEPVDLKPSVSTLPTAAVPGEKNAPSCEELLATTALDQRSRWELVRSARRALVRGDLDGSQRALCQASRHGPADAIVLLELAQLLLLRRDAGAAAQFARQATELEPRSSRALGLLGDAAIRTGDLDGARAAWLSAFNVSADDAAGIERLVQRAQADARRALAERDPARAERLLRRVLALEPGHPTAQADLALALSRLGLDRDAAP